MTTKTAGRKERAAPPVAPGQDTLQAAYQAHTLAQMLYGHLAMIQPWTTANPPGAGFDPAQSFVAGPTVPGWHGTWGPPQMRGGPLTSPFLAPYGMPGFWRF